MRFTEKLLILLKKSKIGGKNEIYREITHFICCSYPFGFGLLPDLHILRRPHILAKGADT